MTGRRRGERLLIARPAIAKPAEGVTPVVALSRVAGNAPVGPRLVSHAGRSARIKGVWYLGPDHEGQDQFEVQWVPQSFSNCGIWAESQTASQLWQPSLAYEVTLKITRTCGSEASVRLRKSERVQTDAATILKIPRCALDGEPASFEATLRVVRGETLLTMGLHALSKARGHRIVGEFA